VMWFSFRWFPLVRRDSFGLSQFGVSSSSASASVMATEERMTEMVAKKATTNDPANAIFFFM
jgi:hypothetical protein